MAENKKGPEIVMGQTPAAFDIEKALRTKGFPEFLAKHPFAENLDLSNPDDADAESAVQKCFETFEMKGEAAKSVKELYAGQIKEDLGIILTKEELVLIDNEIERQAVESPAHLKLILSGIEVQKAQSRLINLLEKELEELLRNGDPQVTLEAMKQVKDVSVGQVEDLKKYSDLVGKGGRLSAGLLRTSMYIKQIWNMVASEVYAFDTEREAMILQSSKELKSKVRNIHGNINVEGAEKLSGEIKSRIATIEENITKLTRLEDVNEQFANIRTEMLSGVAGVHGLEESIRRRVNDSLLRSKQRGNLADLRAMQEQIDVINEGTQVSEMNLDVLGDFGTPEAQEELDQMFFKKAVDDVFEVLSQTNLGNDPLSAIEKVTSKLIVEDKFGSTEGADARERVIDAINDAIIDLDKVSGHLSKETIVVRKLLCQSIIRKIKAKK